MDLGEIIKNRRLELGLTQNDLAEGICAQALISRIEKGKLLPKKSILNQLEERLSLKPNQLIKVKQDADQFAQISNLKEVIRKQLSKRDYEIIEALLESNENLIDSITNKNDQAFFTWIKASIEDKIYQNKDLALEMLINIPLENVTSELALEIINAVGVIYFIANDYEKAANVFQNNLNLINDEVHFKVQAKVMLNYCLVLDKLKKYKKALLYISEGIDLLLEHKSLFLLGDYHHAKAHIFYTLANYTEAEKNIEIAATIFELQGNKKLLAISKLALTELNNLKKEGQYREDYPFSRFLSD